MITYLFIALGLLAITVAINIATIANLIKTTRLLRERIEAIEYETGLRARCPLCDCTIAVRTSGHYTTCPIFTFRESRPS